MGAEGARLLCSISQAKDRDYLPKQYLLILLFWLLISVHPELNLFRFSFFITLEIINKLYLFPVNYFIKNSIDYVKQKMRECFYESN